MSNYAVFLDVPLKHNRACGGFRGDPQLHTQKLDAIPNVLMATCGSYNENLMREPKLPGA